MAFAVAGMAGVWSFISGSLCVAMPSAYFAWVSQRTMQPGRIVAQGIVKMLSTCALMAGCLKMGVDDVLWFFSRASGMPRRILVGPCPEG